MVESTHQSPVAVHIHSGTFFEKRRQPSGAIVRNPEDIFFWHMGYVLSDQRMEEKIRTFGHAHEVLPDWFHEKWLKWTPDTIHLFRKNPASRWPRTIKIDPMTLPEILYSHPSFPLKSKNNRRADTVQSESCNRFLIAHEAF